ncbi:hypothetical protein [Streptomyces brevispora]|uniref:Uncharacterized protein n=1 Tax=Streptomyces brevispora TaxID=887462 RepID=A0A561V5F9_9ACTN|nr:hypothetical protein [Streptomyces brevispora]TWG06824.1 hypothetical protein FHX80_115320 [Streptomyces brevispora]WSC12307.1 hypothetical protein OIE64_05230 [Streptomyces brevispora]
MKGTTLQTKLLAPFSGLLAGAALLLAATGALGVTITTPGDDPWTAPHPESVSGAPWTHSSPNSARGEGSWSSMAAAMPKDDPWTASGQDVAYPPLGSLST